MKLRKFSIVVISCMLYFPILNDICREQLAEKEIEATIRGIMITLVLPVHGLWRLIANAHNKTVVLETSSNLLK